MTFYALTLFLHIIGAVLLFATLTAEGTSILYGGSAASINRVVGPISALLILVPGVYLVVTTWGWMPWVLVGIAAWVVVAVLGTVSGVRSSRGGPAASSASWWIRVGLVTGVFFLMTTKPDLVGSLASVLIGAAVGYGISAVARRTRRTA
jgi:hypothetical protein